MIDLKTYPKDLQYASELLGSAVETLMHGSWAARHPANGKMVNCPLCGRRRRELPDIPCCTTAHTTTKRAWSEEKGFYQVECEPRVNLKNILPAKTMRKMRHKLHRNLLNKQVHDLAMAFSNSNFLKEIQNKMEGLAPFHRPNREILETATPAFAEKVVRMERKKRANQKRSQQKESRRINR